MILHWCKKTFHGDSKNDQRYKNIIYIKKKQLDQNADKSEKYNIKHNKFKYHKKKLNTCEKKKSTSDSQCEQNCPTEEAGERLGPLLHKMSIENT